MRELVVDLTPTCVNRTAIYHVAMDTYAALEQRFDVTPQYRGARLPRPADRAAESEITDAFLKDMRRWASQSVHTDEIDSDRAIVDDRAPRLYFDPIYALYRALSAQDVVFLLDMSTLTNPEWHEPSVSVAYERAFRKLLASPAKVVCISEHCAAALRASFAIPQNDIATVPLYLRMLPSCDGTQPDVRVETNKFFLFVGSLETRKNLIGLIRAFAVTGLSAQGWKLVVAGGPGQGYAAILDAGAEIEGVEILGFVSETELSWLYENAAAFAYPSYLEGFGLPLLEAMAHGLPCLASITGASYEVCGDLAVLVDPYHLPSIVEGLIICARRAQRPDAAARERRAERANRFTFQRYIDALMPILDTTARGEKPSCTVPF